jgi:hypothetical protein
MSPYSGLAPDTVSAFCAISPITPAPLALPRQAASLVAVFVTDPSGDDKVCVFFSAGGLLFDFVDFLNFPTVIIFCPTLFPFGGSGYFFCIHYLSIVFLVPVMRANRRPAVTCSTGHAPLQPQGTPVLRQSQRPGRFRLAKQVLCNWV